MPEPDILADPLGPDVFWRHRGSPGGRPRPRLRRFDGARENLAGGLVGASEAVELEGNEPCPDRMLFGSRLRDTHDLYHVVTGYGRDLFGEAALLSFTYRQIQNLGIGFILLVAYAGARGEFVQERVLI